MPEFSEIWWDTIAGPRNFCDAVVQALQDKSSVSLLVPDDLPWRNEMRLRIETRMHRLPYMEQFYVEFIDVADECPEVDDIGRYLLKRFADPIIATGYRSRGTIQEYICNKHALDNRVVWIKGMNPEQEKNWLRFCKSYSVSDDYNGRFVLETRWTDNENEQRNYGVIRYKDLIKQYDLTLFNSIYLNIEKPNYNPIWQQYAAVACSLLCKTDAEISHAFMETCDFKNEELITGMRKIAQDDMYQRRGENDEKHILSMVRNEEKGSIAMQVWKAQLQVIYPLIEIERVSFVDRYYDQIKDALGKQYYDYQNYSARTVFQFGEEIDNPDEAELGTLYRLTKLKCYNDQSQYLLYIPDEQARQRLELLHSIRNALAHGEACTADEIKAFIDGHPFVWPRLYR
jgi:hypothetical protein